MNSLIAKHIAAIGALALLSILGSNDAALAQAQKAPPPAAGKSAAPAPAPQDIPPLKQIALTEKQVTSLIAAQKEMDALTAKLPEGAADKPDPKLQAQFDGVVKKNGFADYAEYGDVYDNVSLVMSGIDPKTKAFTEPPEVLKKQIAQVQADAKIPAKDKKAILDDMNAGLKTVTPVQFPANVILVTKYYDPLSALLSDDE